MSNIVILAEKPSQAKAYSEAFTIKRKNKSFIEIAPCSTFPLGAIITWGIGHLVELREPKEYKKEWGSWNLATLPILPDEYEFKVVKDKYLHFNFIKNLFNNPEITTIINACDIDREGSNIFYSIYNMTGAKNKTIKRLWINSLEIDEIRKGFNNLQDNNKDLLLYEEARTRQISDWIVGMNGSRLYTLLLQQKGYRESLPIGRVQSPTVYLIYQRQKEIENFVSKPFYEIEAEFTAKNGIYKGKAKIKSESKEEIQSILSKHNISTQNEGLVKSVTKREKRIKSPRLHALSTLQTTANKKWRYSPAKVLKLAQALYEKKLITYPRTDTQFITLNEFDYLSSKIELFQKVADVSFPIVTKQPNKRFVDSYRVNEHYAIIPTKNIPSESTLQSLPIEERNIYFEILNTMLAMFHSDYVYEETKILTVVNGLEFVTTGKRELSRGWKELFPEIKKSQKDSVESENKSLPLLEKGESVISVVKLKEGKTTPPKPYTEGQLIDLMKTCGKLVENEEDMEILKEVEGLGTEATRSSIIETIKKHGYIKVTKNILSVTPKGEMLCKTIDGNLLSSPSMTAKWETYLKKIGRGEGTHIHFLSNIEKFIYKLIEEVPNQVQNLSVGNSISDIQSSKQAILCPTCNKGEINFRGSFYGCSNYANGCKQTFPAKILGKKLTEKQINDLCTKGKTGIIKGLKSKSGKSFNASLRLDGQNIKFEFINNRR